MFRALHSAVQLHVKSHHPAVLSLPILHARGVVDCDPRSTEPLWHIDTRGAIAISHISKLPMSRSPFSF